MNEQKIKKLKELSEVYEKKQKKAQKSWERLSNYIKKLYENEEIPPNNIRR